MGWMPQPKDKDWLNGYKNKTSIYVVYKRPASKQGTHIDWKRRDGKKKMFQTNRDQKKAGIAIFISDKIDFKIKTMERNKEWHYIIIKGSIQEKDIITINLYAPNIGALQYVRQMLTSMKEKINSNPVIVGDFNTLLTPMEKSTEMKISKKIQTLNFTMD